MVAAALALEYNTSKSLCSLRSLGSLETLTLVPSSARMVMTLEAPRGACIAGRLGLAPGLGSILVATSQIVATGVFGRASVKVSTLRRT